MRPRREVAVRLVALVVGLTGAGCLAPGRSGDGPPAARLPSTSPVAARSPGAPAVAAAKPSPKPTPIAQTPPASEPAWVQAGPTTPAAPPPPPPPGREESADRVHALARQAAEAYRGIDSYIARLHRREQVNGRPPKDDVLLFKFRKEPFSVYFKWIGAEGTGREVVYVHGRYGGQIHTLLAAGDMPLMPAGRRMALAPDNPFVRAASRHSITEAGIGTAVERFAATLAALDRGDRSHGSAAYRGPVRRPEYSTPLECVELTLPPGADPQLPRGGRRRLMFDPASHLPVLITTEDDAGHEVEYYCYDRLQFPVRLDDDDFNPDKLWPAKH